MTLDFCKTQFPLLRWTCSSGPLARILVASKVDRAYIATQPSHSSETLRKRVTVRAYLGPCGRLVGISRVDRVWRCMDGPAL